MNDPGRVVILGAGPTGLGAAYRLEEAGFENFVLVEATDRAGGLAASYLDDSGFTWDVGGHVQFSHYVYYDDLLDRALGDAWLWHERESWVWIRKRFVPYPFQNNIHRLDSSDRDRLLAGMVAAVAERDVRSEPPANFREWIRMTSGEALGEFFLYPYNFKVWAYPPEMLGTSWLGERVAVPDVDRVRENIRLQRDDVSWGPNNRFRYPLRGGTGAIWSGVAALLDQSRHRYKTSVERVDAGSKHVILSSGEVLPYDVLISTMPLDTLVKRTAGLDSALAAVASRLVYSASHIVGVGLRGPQPATLSKKCWMYFPEEHSPYYRVTVFSNYSPYNVPDDECWSLMAEVAESHLKHVDAERVGQEVVAALKRDELLPLDASIESVWHMRADHGYPTPFVGRDEILAVLNDALEQRSIYSRGRFGAWRYEVSNQDHACMQGVELAERLLGVGEEVTVRDPARANSGAFLRR